MKNNPQITIQEVKRLNAERTQGEWELCAHLRDHEKCGADIEAIFLQVGELWVCEMGASPLENGDKYAPESPRKTQYIDAQFIAAAPAIASLCLSQHEEIERLRKAATDLLKEAKACLKYLDTIYEEHEMESHCPNPDGVNIAIKNFEQALSNQDEGVR